MAARSDVSATADREIVNTRVFDAPRELVWKAWTEQQHVQKWWGPRGFTQTFETFETKEGGEWIFMMHGPDGTNYPNRMVFLEVVPPERLVFSHGGGKEGGPADVDFQTTVTFEAEGSQTRVTMRGVFASAAARDHVVKEYGAIEGGQQHLACLAEYLETLR